MKIKLILLASLLTFSTQAEASGVRVTVRVGETHSHHRVICERPVRYPECHRPPVIILTPTPVVIVRSDPRDKMKQIEAFYYMTGKDWGQDLRNDVVTWDEAADYFHKNIETLDVPALYSSFREGFVKGYGTHGKEAFDKLVEMSKE